MDITIDNCAKMKTFYLIKLIENNPEIYRVYSFYYARQVFFFDSKHNYKIIYIHTLTIVHLIH